MPRNEELLATAGDWFYESCHCIVSLGNNGVAFTYECELCGNKNLRFIHTLGHWGPDGEADGRQIQVGIECASSLVGSGDEDVARLAENEVKRKERWRVRYRRPGRCVTTIDDLVERGKL